MTLKVGDKVVNGYGETGTVVFISDDPAVPAQRRCLIGVKIGNEAVWAWRRNDGTTDSMNMSTTFKKVPKTKEVTEYLLHYKYPNLPRTYTKGFETAAARDRYKSKPPEYSQKFVHESTITYTVEIEN